MDRGSRKVQLLRNPRGLASLPEEPMARWLVFLASGTACAALFGSAPAVPPKPAAQFEGKDTLLRPEGYREWVFAGSQHRRATRPGGRETVVP